MSGCSTYQTEPIRRDMRIIVKSPVQHENPNKLGEATYIPSTNTCVITLAKYPLCLLHEIRHCLEGNWHEGRDSFEDC